MLPYGFGGGAIVFRPAGADEVAAGAVAFGFAFATTGAGAGAGVVTGVVGPSSSSGSPIEIVEGTGAGSLVATGATSTFGSALALGVARFGSSVETAITAAAVRRTTTPPPTAIAIRSPRLAFFGAGAGGGMLRIGPRPVLMSRAV